MVFQYYKLNYIFIQVAGVAGVAGLFRKYPTPRFPNLGKARVGDFCKTPASPATPAT